MKRIFLLLIAISISNSIFTQTENYKIAFDNFQEKYNTEKYDEIFNSFSSKMQSSLPLEKTKQFLSDLKADVGKIKDKEYVSDESGTVAFYKMHFERAVLGVSISLDNQNKIAGLSIKPYEETKLVESTRINALDNFPDKYTEIIFSKSKNLPNNSQLSIAIIQNGETEYYGTIRDDERIRAIENQQKVFEIGSITKVFTATVLASLVEDRKIKLTDEINCYYPFGLNDGIRITFESLANHTSGLPRLPENLDLTNRTNPYKNYGKNEIEEYLKDLLEIEDNSRKTYSYSNLGAGLLGYTLGLSQKTTFQELLQKMVFDKYNMKNSFTTSQNLENNLVTGLDEQGNKVSNWDFDALFGAGGMLSTTEDLAKFVNAQTDTKNTELKLTREPTFDIKENFRIGLGWHILKSENDSVLYWHNGGTGGYSSSMVIDLENKAAVVILSNVSGINEMIDDLGFELLKTTEK